MFSACRTLPWRIGLFGKMGLVLTPVFLIVAACGLWFLSAQTTLEADDALSNRLGSAAARVTSALERHATRSTSANPWSEPLPTELINTLLSDQAVRCAIFKREDTAVTTLVAPLGLGCTGQKIDSRFSLNLFTGVPSSLEIGYDQSEIRKLRATWLTLSALLLLCGLFLSIGAAWLGFRMFIRNPLDRLLESIETSERSGIPASVPVRQSDELGSVITAFNAMQMKDSEKTKLLETERTRFARILDSMMDGLLVVDRDTRVVMANSASARLLDRPVQQLVGTSILTLFRSTGSRPQQSITSSTVEASRPDGTEFTVQTSVSSVYLNHEPVSICVFRDITDVIERERALQKTSLEALSASKAKTEFLANMSHELRTPLNAIIGFSEIIAAGIIGNLDGAKNADYARDINDSGQHLLALINDILDIAKVETGEVTLYRESVDLRELFQSVERTMRTHAFKRGVSLLVVVPDTEITLVADVLRLKQVLMNLMSNAIKFTEKGGLVSIEAVQENRSVTLTVKDTGIGMTPNEIDEAMKPFRQVDNSTTRHFEGTGLGLPLSKSFVELHGGTFEIRSVSGRGTEVAVTFPEMCASPDGTFDDERPLADIAC